VLIHRKDTRARETGFAAGGLKVSEYCDYGGTVFVLHFGMLHRACRNLPGSVWRN
jgi:hypothetical protein